MRHLALRIIVFVSGAVILAFEVVGSRVLAPYFGTSIIVWTALIGVILAALSLGYWLGGRLADKYPDPRGLAWLLIGGGFLIALVALGKDFVLPGLAASVNEIRIGTLAAAFILFAPASVLLGTVSPYAARLALRDVEHAGSVVGSISALSTLGSIAGTFLAGFFLLPLMGHTMLLAVLAGLEALLALLLFWSARSAAAVGVVVALCVAAVGVQSARAGVVDIDTRYGRILVFDDIEPQTGRQLKRMQISGGQSSAMYLDDTEALAYDYTRFYRLGDHFAPAIERALVIGGGAYSYPKDFLVRHPKAQLDVVEIDEGVTELAREYFALPNTQRLHIYHEDARTYLNQERGTYDAIYLDAFRSNAIPHQLTSYEAFAQMYAALDEDGVLVANVISSLEGERGRFFQALYATIRSVFPQVHIFHVPDAYDPKLAANIMLVAMRNERAIARSSDDREINEYLSREWSKPVPPTDTIFTDEHNPSDYLAAAYLSRLGRAVSPLE